MASPDRTARRIELEVMTVVIGWRDVVADIRAGYIGSSRESIHEVTVRALELLTNIENAHAADAPAVNQLAGELVADARAEVQGATFHDLADSGEAAG